MKLSEPSIKALGQLITGDCDMTTVYRSGPELVRFFNKIGANEAYGKGFPSRWNFAEEMIRNFNSSQIISDIIIASINPVYFNAEHPIEEAINYLNKYLVSDGYLIVEDTKSLKSVTDMIVAFSGQISNGTLAESLKKYKILRLDGMSGITPESLSTLSHEFIIQQIEKSRSKLASEDYDGAITNARALAESVQEEIIKKCGSDIPNHKGDLGDLYKKGTQKVLMLDPSQADLNTPLKQVLSGFNSVIAGLAGISNKMGDRHSRQYKPSLHHAKLAVNSALTFCEFLLDSYEYQKKMRELTEHQQDNDR